MDLTTKKNIHPFLGILILLFSISILNIPVLETIWRYSFDDGTYSHAYLIPVISLYLYYTLATEGKLEYRKKISLPFTLLLVASCYLLFITTNAQISVGYWFSFLLICVISILMLYRFTWKVVFPAAFLVFILPFWGILVPILQNLSIIAVTFIMSFTGIPTFVEVQTITIPAGVFEIAGGCSGLRYLLVSLAISSMFIFLYINNLKKAALFFVVAVLGALLTNWIRITLLIVIGEYTDMQSSLMEDHNTFGWYLYIPFMFLLFRWGNRLIDPQIEKTETEVQIIQSKPNLINVLATSFVLLLSSTTLASLLTINTTTPLVESNNIVSPQIFNYSKIESSKITNSNSIINLKTYHFYGHNLDGKPTYFENNMIPIDWNVKRQYVKDSWMIYDVFKGNKIARIFMKFEIIN